MTRILVTSAEIANGGYGALLGFDSTGQLIGPFSSDPRIVDPRGLSLDPSGSLIYLNSGDDRVLALDHDGKVVRDSGRTPEMDPGGGTFGPDGRYYVGLRRRWTILAMPAGLDGRAEPLLPEGIVPFPRGFGFAATVAFISRRASVPREKATTRSSRSIAAGAYARVAWSPTRSSAPLISRSLIMATSSSRASGPSALPTPSRACANTTRTPDGFFACSRPTARLSSAGREGCDSDRMITCIA